jgi:hypothetical protein
VHGNTYFRLAEKAARTGISALRFLALLIKGVIPPGVLQSSSEDPPFVPPPTILMSPLNIPAVRFTVKNNSLGNYRIQLRVREPLRLFLLFLFEPTESRLALLASSSDFESSIIPNW